MLVKIKDLHGILKDFYLAGSTGNNDVKCKYKWLKYIAEYFGLHPSFFTSLNNQLVGEINKSLDYEFDYTKIWVFVEPNMTGLDLFEDLETNVYYYHLRCSLAYQTKHLEGIIIFYVLEKHIEINFLEDTSHLNIVFEWNLLSKRDKQYIQQFPSNLIKRKPRTYLINKLKIETYLTSMPHEGKFAITLWNIDDVENVSRVLEQARQEWNNQTDKAREIGDESLERGYCHNITFDGIDEKVAYWYIDGGSAHEGIHEFLLKGLSDSGIKIKHVEIQGL